MMQQHKLTAANRFSGTKAGVCSALCAVHLPEMVLTAY